MATVTAHAAQRYIERVDPTCSLEAARAELASHARAVDAAAAIGCPTVRLGNGVRLKLDGDQITTVIGPARRRPLSQRARQGGLHAR